MNINKPDTSRTLAKLIQMIVFEDRERFIEDAKKAKSLEQFAKTIGKYRIIPGALSE